MMIESRLDYGQICNKQGEALIEGRRLFVAKSYIYIIYI